MKLNLRVLAFTLSFGLMLIWSGCELDIPEPDPEPEDIRSNSLTITRDDSVLPNAKVSVLTESRNFSAKTDEEGKCRIRISNDVDLPEYVIVTIDHSSIRPKAISVPGSINSSISRMLDCRNLPSVVLVRDCPVHHLGNDVYDGAANSQHQLSTEGVKRSYNFSLSGIPTIMPSLQLYARGIEFPTEIIINGIKVNQLGDSSPDGSLSFWDFQLSGNPGTVLQPGNNTLTIHTNADNLSDPWDEIKWDDIEFCGLLLYYE